MTNPISLLRCFCGGAGEVDSIVDKHGTDYVITCSDCGFMSSFCGTERESAKQWNIAVSPWRSFKNCPPDHGQLILAVWLGFDGKDPAENYMAMTYSNDWDNTEPDAWMPIPEIPEELE